MGISVIVTLVQCQLLEEELEKMRRETRVFPVGEKERPGQRGGHRQVQGREVPIEDGKSDKKVYRRKDAEKKGGREFYGGKKEGRGEFQALNLSNRYLHVWRLQWQLAPTARDKMDSVNILERHQD